jgi:hypothetical protein
MSDFLTHPAPISPWARCPTCQQLLSYHWMWQPCRLIPKLFATSDRTAGTGQGGLSVALALLVLHPAVG